MYRIVSYRIVSYRIGLNTLFQRSNYKNHKTKKMKKRFKKGVGDNSKFEIEIVKQNIFRLCMIERYDNE
jgi:hypothetical protein